MDAQTLRAWRRQRGLTQEALAKALGVSRRVVNGWERNTILIPKMVALAIWALDRGQKLPE